MMAVPFDPYFTWLLGRPYRRSEAVVVSPVKYLNYEPTQAVNWLQLYSSFETTAVSLVKYLISELTHASRCYG